MALWAEKRGKCSLEMYRKATNELDYAMARQEPRPPVEPN
jgi:hypothetical protein